MSLKTGFAAVLKAIRTSRGLTHKHMADPSSRGYMSKLEQARSSPTVDKLTAISETLGLSPLTLVTLTLSVESGQSIDALVRKLNEDVVSLDASGALKGLGIVLAPNLAPTGAVAPRRQRVPVSSSQAEFCFAE